MKDYQMCMVTALVLNKKYNFSRIVYPRFVQTMLDHAYPNLLKDEQNDLMVLHHMDNETLIRLSKYTKNWPEPKKTKFFGFIKDEKYEDQDPVNHLKWRNDAEMNEKSAIDELTKLEDFSETRNDWYTKEEKKKKGGKKTPTPKAQAEEGSSSQPQKKHRKKAVETLIVDEPEVDETEVDDDEEKSLSGSEVDVDAEVDRWIKENYDPRNRERQKKKKRSSDDADETYMFHQRMFRLYKHHLQEVERNQHQENVLQL
ncbi:hypothetical protein Hanom_Chr02g00096041 [Helianthus anomalus]